MYNTFKLVGMIHPFWLRLSEFKKVITSNDVINCTMREQEGWTDEILQRRKNNDKSKKESVEFSWETSKENQLSGHVASGLDWLCLVT